MTSISTQGAVVFVLRHEHSMLDGCEGLKMLGIEYVVDESDGWSEGFSTFYDGKWQPD